MKVALLGNTCNNNFSFLRYLLDLGVDAHLYLYSNEGRREENPLHAPKWDTFNSNSFENKVSYLDVPNGLISVIGRPDKLCLPLNLSKFSQTLSKYDLCVGSGLSPAIFFRLKRSLDIFYPYGTGLEWVNDNETKMNLLTLNLEWPFRKLLTYLQLQGLRKTKRVTNWLPGITEEVFKKYSINTHNMHIPAYYAEEINAQPNQLLKNLNEHLIKRITDQNRFKIFSFMRHYWVYKKNLNYKNTWMNVNKNNDLLIRGFANFINKFPEKNCTLFLSEWGIDLEDSRQLVKELNIENQVAWMPLMPRSYITYIFSNYANLAVGEFVISENEHWGNTAWECLALGVPFMQTVNYTENSFKKFFGYGLPPEILNVKTFEDVSSHINETYNKSNKSCIKLSRNIDWFKKYNGHSLTRNWINIFEDLVSEKKKKK